ncbi:MAG TPA: ATP-binding cassette domain-containing protein, partial [Candidatus Acidoferrum sp.]|nr:ATP-binding cassette domain-containing protein [Candidatus Acidoferrum sp.]
MSLLCVSNLSKNFGALRALHEVSFEVAEKEILGIIGPNGAGKTTLFNILVGLEKPDGGEGYFRGRNLKNLRPHEVCGTGLTKTSQVVRPFLTFSVMENILVALMFGRKLSRREAEKETG